jgi:hypothetical protein
MTRSSSAIRSSADGVPGAGAAQAAAPCSSYSSRQRRRVVSSIRRSRQIWLGRFSPDTGSCSVACLNAALYRTCCPIQTTPFPPPEVLDHITAPGDNVRSGQRALAHLW